MANYFRVLAVMGKYRAAVADYDTVEQASAAIADASSTAAWDAHIKSIFLQTPTGYEAVERSV